MATTRPDSTAPAVGNKDDRIYIRTTREQKTTLAEAARARRLRTSEFVLQASLAVAEEVFAQEQRILLSERDFAHFVEVINNPKPPTTDLQDSMVEYRRLKTTNPEANLRFCQSLNLFKHTTIARGSTVGIRL